MNVLMIICTNDGETIYKAMRLANVGVKKGDEVSVFMLGKGVLFEQAGSEQFYVIGQGRYVCFLMSHAELVVPIVPRSGVQDT